MNTRKSCGNPNHSQGPDAQIKQRGLAAGIWGVRGKAALGTEASGYEA